MQIESKLLTRLFVTLQHLYDRLCDHWKTGNRVQTLMIVGHLVRREPLWLSRIVSHPLLSLILKGLKVISEFIFFALVLS